MREGQRRNDRARFDPVRARELELVARERASTSYISRAQRASRCERASELYWERLAAVWPSVTTRSEGPRNVDHSALKGLCPPRSPIESVHLVPLFVVPFHLARSHPREERARALLSARARFGDRFSSRNTRDRAIA